MSTPLVSSFRDSFWRAGQSSPRDVRIDLCWLVGLCLALVAVGIGFRDPWPADEPRFALIARDMVRTGQWLFPQVGNDWYADKPPVFFWLIASIYWLTGSLRIAFALPSVLATLAATLLVYDLLRRVWNRETAFISAWLLLITFQFVWQGRQAQIDAVLYGWTTLSLYGLLRHLLLGPQWRWYAIGCAAAGFGVITKGVGFLPLLLLAVYAVLQRLGWRANTERVASHGRWWWGIVAFLAAVCVWLVPMLLAANTPELIAYRNEILFHQTVNRYASAWHHHEPFWYFLVQVIPPLWLPLSAFIPWLWPRWRDALRAKDLRIGLPLVWVLIVVIFFSASPGKRGVYVLPAIPALVMAAAPFLSDLFRQNGVQRLFRVLVWFLTGLTVISAIYICLSEHTRADLLSQYDVDARMPLALLAIGTTTMAFLGRKWHGAVTYAAILTVIFAVIGCVINPAINRARSGERFVQKVEAAAHTIPELGLVGYKEQYLLWFKRSTVNFGHARWREADVEAKDAAAWLADHPQRGLLVPGAARDLCFAAAQSIALGNANSTDWFLVTGAADPKCVAEGNKRVARSYDPFARL